MSARPAERPPAAAWWWPPLIIAPLAAFQLFAFHWGVVMPDTLFQWGQAVTGRYDDWHPPATTWLWRQLMTLGPGTAPILLFQLALYWSGAWLIADALRRRGSMWAMAATLGIAALPIPLGQICAILKDPLLAACCLAALGLALAFPDRRSALGAALLLLVFASATRFNAAFATAPLLCLWLPERWTGRPAGLIAAMAAAAILLGGAGWLIDSVALRPHRSQPIFSLVNFDLAGIVAHGGAGVYPGMDPAAEAALVARCYDPGQFNPGYRADCDAAEQALRDHATVTGQGAPLIWAGAVARFPIAYAGHRLAHLNRNARFLVAGIPDDAVYIMATPTNRYGLSFHEGPAAAMIYRAAGWLAWSPLGRPATWLAVAAGLLAIASRLPSGRIVAAAAGSALAYGVAYGVVSVAPDLRYNLWTMLAAMIALTVAAADRPGRRLLVALVPAATVVLAEIAALIP